MKRRPPDTTSNLPQPNSPDPATSEQVAPEQDAVEQLAEAAEGHHDEAAAVLRFSLPWAVSLLLHTAVVLIALFAVWAVTIDADEDDTIVPEMRLGKLPSPPLKSQHRTKRAQRSARRTVVRTAMASRQDTAKPTRLIGVRGAAPGKASPFKAIGARTGGGTGVSFWGTGGNARRIAFVIDASGSLLGTFEFVIKELKRSINELSDQQSFTIIFFQGDGDPREVPPAGLRSADAKRKQEVIKWIDPASGHITVGGGTDPVKAIELALKRRPQLMFLLSDNITGRDIYEVDQRHLLKAIKKANKQKTIINTIQFIWPDPLETITGKGTMQLIAESNGGRYKFVDRREVGLE